MSNMYEDRNQHGGHETGEPPGGLLSMNTSKDQRSYEESGSRREHDGGGTESGTSDQMMANSFKTEDQGLQPIPDDLDKVLERLKKEIGLGVSFDLVVREMTIGDRRTAFFYMNGLTSSLLLTEIITRLTYLTPDHLSGHAFKAFFNEYVPAAQASEQRDWNKMLTSVMSGDTVFFIDKESYAVIIDAKNFPARGPEEPSIERVVRGSRDGFTETLMVNVSLIRRRLRDPMLRYELVRIGERTKTDVCIAYIDDLVDKELMHSIKDKITSVKLDGLPLADKQLEEATFKLGWNPFPNVRYSERPDVVAAHMLEGSVAVLVDTSPSVMLLPTTFFDLIQHAEENRQTPFIGTYLRWVRFIGIFASLFMLPLWLLFVMHPEYKPSALTFVGPQQTGKLPLVLQFIIAELGVDLMRMASVHTPTPLATAMSLVAAILIGDIAVKTGVFVNEVILYMAIASIGMFATPSYELGLANRIVRLLMIIAVAAFKAPGLIICTTAILIFLCLNRSFNRPYMWPFIPFDMHGMKNILLRVPVLENRLRPNNLRPQQREKMPDSE